MASDSRVVLRPLTYLLIGVGLALVVVGVVYLTKPATDLPAFFPGHQHGVTRHHTKHAITMFGLAALSWIGAWFTTAPDR